MSYIRLSAGDSDVYIYEAANHYVECCLCLLNPNDYYATADLDDMLAHVAAHREVGHVVPDWLDDVLRTDWPPDEEREDHDAAEVR